MSQSARTCFVLALLIGAVGCGCSLEREMAKWERVKRQAAEVLREQSDPDSLAAAALLTARRAPADALTLISAAVAAAPERPELVWLHIRVCTETNGCNPRPFETRLRELDPANAFGWFGDLARAIAVDDQPSLDAAIAAAGRTQRADFYYTTLTAHLGRAAMRAGASLPPDAAMAVIGEVSGFGLPNFVAATKGCGVERLDRAGVREACRSLAAALMAGDTVIAEMIGAAIAKRAWPPESPQWQAASEARRIYKYRGDVMMEAERGSELDDAKLLAYLEIAGQHRREQDVLVAQIKALGIDPTPPTDWVEAAPR